MAKPGPKPGSGKSGGAAVGRLGGRPRARMIVEAELTAETMKTLKALALVAGASVEARASTLLANAIEEEWDRYNAESSKAAEAAWEGDIL